MAFRDDEQTVPSSNSGRPGPPAKGPKPVVRVVGRMQLAVYKNEKAPLTQNRQQVMLELTGAASVVGRMGLDLVAVLDVSGSMQGEKLAKVKTALLFLIKKLSDMDRLSIVTFSSGATRLCPLRFVTEASQKDLKGLVDGLVADGGTNISDGLQTGLKVVAGRRLSAGRVVSIMLMSDGEQNQGGDAKDVQVGDVPVYTFGFGADHDATVLNAIASKAPGGTFNYVQDGVNLSEPFSQLLGGLLSVVVQDLRLTVAPKEDESTIEKVDPGSYPQTKAGSAVTVSFGALYGREVRKVIVDLLLPAVDSDEYDADILDVQFSYSGDDPAKRFDSPVETPVIHRSGRADPDDRKREVQTELARRQHASMIKEARTMADAKNLDDARDKLVDAQNALEDTMEQSSPMMEMLKAELGQLLKLFKSDDLYKKQGRAYALSSETSHERQRFAARGNVEAVRLFATPRMDKYLEQAKRFEEDPDMALPSAEDDDKDEIAANPLAVISGPLAFYIKAAIQALQSIEKIITAAQ